MMFNGFLVYGDSDTSASDVTKSSIGPVSLGSGSDSTRTAHVEDQLNSTMQILKNKEETVRVQAESLALAEARIADLSRRLDALGRPDRTEPTRTRECSVSCCVSATDAETSVHLQDEELVVTLRDNLAVVEQLYRDSFYEMARQAETMDALRRANAQLRARERRYAARYRELAAEVERLKCDVSDVIGSNSDSGVWGAGSARASGGAARSAGDCDAGAGTGDSDDSAGEVKCGEGEVAGGLRHVASQLRRLRDMLSCECTCGLADENKRLKLANDSLERETRELRERVRQLEGSKRDKDSVQHKGQFGRAETRDGGAEVKRDSGAVADTLSSQLLLLQGVLNEKTGRLQSAEGKTQRLRERLKKMDFVVKENVAVSEQLSQLSLQVERLRRAGEGAGRPHTTSHRHQEEPIPGQTSFIDLPREHPCMLAGPCARVRAGRHERDTERCARVRAGRQHRGSEEPCARCGSDCACAPPVPPRRSVKKNSLCDKDCWCGADCGCCPGGSCSHHHWHSTHGHRAASETLERIAVTREALRIAQLRWQRHAPSYS